jgi:pimeloyl-ACP methyl ester carboxylesterase
MTLGLMVVGSGETRTLPEAPVLFSPARRFAGGRYTFPDCPHPQSREDCMSIRRFAAWLWCIGILPALNVSAATTTSNLEREQSWAEEIVDLLVVGEPVWLQNRGHKFLALYTPPARAGRTAVILAHGRGVHPAWGLIDKLRSDLADAGYHTLSLQMPILAADAPFGNYGQTFPEAFERMTAGIRYLRLQKNVDRVILLGHSSGAIAVVGYAAKHPQPAVAGVVAIGLSTYQNTVDVMQSPRMLRQVQVPVLDIYGSNDLQEVLSYTKQRQDAARAGQLKYTSRMVPGADHFFTDHYNVLKTEITRWLHPLRTQ